MTPGKNIIFCVIVIVATPWAQCRLDSFVKEETFGVANLTTVETEGGFPEFRVRYLEECEGKLGSFYVLTNTELDACYNPAVKCFDRNSDGWPRRRVHSPRRLVGSAIHAIHKAAASEEELFSSPMPDFVIHLGQMVRPGLYLKDLGVDVQKAYEYSIRLFPFFCKELLPGWNGPARFPLVILGNDDYPVHVQEIEWRGKVASLLDKHFHGDQKAMESFVALGSYRLRLSVPVDLVVLNTLPLSPRTAHGDERRDGQTKRHAQLVWLYERLHEANRERRRVFLFGHYPPVDELWWSDHIKEYHAIVDAFKHDTLFGQFWSHGQDHHSSSFRADNGNLMFIHNAISPKRGNNPTFRRYVYCRSSGEVLDYKEWYADLERLNPELGIVWRVLQHSARDSYGLKHLESRSVTDWAYRLYEREDSSLVQRSHNYLWGFPSDDDAGLGCKKPCVCEIACTTLFWQSETAIKRYCPSYLKPPKLSLSRPHNATIALQGN